MARFWGICSLMLLPAFLLLESQAASIPVEDESSSSAIDFDTGYLIIAPKVFVAESVETICISLQNMTGPLEVAIRLMDNFTAMAKLPIQFMEFKMACYNLEVPSIEYEMMHATLVVKLRRTLVTQSGFEVIERRTVTINGVNTEMFIETDKPVYKPGQTVKFRILNINQDLKPDITPVSKIWIESPSGVRMQQWRKQESTDGLIDLEMPMTTDPVPGTWSIVAIHKGRKTTRTFEVDEYVLPKFEVIITPPTYVMINATSTRVKVCGRYTYGQPVRGSFEARITVKSTGWNFRERRTITRREDDTGPSGCSEFPIDLGRLELNSTDFSLWNARLSVDVDYTETSTGVILQANSESAQITRDALKLQFDSPNIFKPGVPYYGKIFVTHPDGSPAAGKLISLSCNTDQGQIFDKNLTSPENGAIEFTVTDINITSTSLNLYAHAPGFNIPSPETYGRQHVYTLHDPATSHYARPQFSPSGSFLQIAPIRGVAAVGSEQTLRIDFTANDPEENPRFKFVVMSRGNIIATRFYRAHKRPKRQAEGGSTSSSGPSRSVPDGSVDGSEDGSIDGIPSVMPSVGEMPSDMGSLDIPSFIPSGSEFAPDTSLESLLFISVPLSLVLGGSSFSSDFSFVPPTDAPVIIVQPGEVYSRELFFRVTTDMVPETRILAYYIRTDGEVVADSVAFRVQKKFENEVDIAFSDEEMMPGAETQIMIHAKPGSLCAVGVVDRSVHILGGDNQLKADKIFASLNKYQLTSSGGYIDASTHCVPEEDEYPQFFPLGRKKRGIFLPGYGSKYQDSSRAFKDMGLLFITNMDVETSPCVGVGSVARGSAEVDNAAEGPIAVPLLNKDNAVFDDGDTLETPELPNDVLETAPRIRSYFPETWLWDLRRTDTVTGETSISMEVPDTVTEWIGSGFCTSVEYGVGVSPPTKLRAFQPFFLSYTLPYSVVRGEVVPVTVTVFNYLTESLVVEVSLELNEGFRMARKSRPRKKVCVGGSQSQSVEFRIQPRKLGNIALQALGLSINDQDALCGNELVSSSVGARDSIYKELLVEAEGTEVDTTQNCYFCPEEAAQSQRSAIFQATSVTWEYLDDSSAIKVRMRLIPDTGHETISGRNLWEMGVYASDPPENRNPTKYGYVENILDGRVMGTTSYRDRELELVGSTPFEPLNRYLCSDSRPRPYLCVEVRKNPRAQPPFSLLATDERIRQCNLFNCHAVSVNVANYRSMRASYGVESAPGERAVPIRVNLMVTPGDSTKTITGNRLWKVSAFGSASPDGSGSRRSEIPNILDSESQRVSMRPSQEMTLSGDVGLPLAEHVGCRPGYEYLCLEFARGDNPTMTFSMNSNVMCRQMDCQPVGDTSRRPNTGNTGSTGHTGNTGSSGNTGNAADTARWQRMGANLQGLGSDTIGASLEIHPHDTTSRITGSDLWRVGAFGSSNREGTGSRKGQIRNILDDRAMRTSMVPRRPITLSGDIGTPLSRRLGCLRGYEYLCLEFDKGDRPSMPFNMESGIMCQEMPSINCDTSDTGHEVESGTVARWSQIAPGYRRNRNRVTATVDVTPHPDTDLIHGNNLWRVGVFGSERSDGSGRRNGEVRDILDYSGRGRTLQPPRGSNQNIIELSGSFNFPDGCTRGYRYLCIEFDKSENPSMDFSMSRPDPGCMEQQCDGPRVDPGGSGTSGGSGGSHTGSSGGSHGDTSVEITGLSWAPVRSRGSNFFDSAEATVNLNFEPGPTFEGSNLWRMGVFASPDSEGQRDRQDETEQILSSADRSRTIQQRRGNTFQISNPRVNISDAGCEGKIYLCFEFGQARNPNPSFSISGPHGNGQTRISCKRQTCRITKSVYVMKVTPTSSNPQIVAQDDNDVRFNVEVRFDRPRTMSITGTDLWRMEAWASNSNRASGRKLSHSTQILNSDFVRDTVVTKGTDSSRIGDFSFTNLEHRIDMRPDVTCKQVKFLCVKLHKDNPHPDFELQVRDNNPDFLMGCLKLQCEAASEKMFVVNNIGISREVNSAVQSGRNNDMLLNLNVVHDRGTSTEVTGQPGWAVQAWGSSKKNGKKAKISPANLNLGAERQQNFDRRTPVRFNRIPYTLDLNDGCQNVKYLCVKLSKTGPGFTLKGRPNSKALTSCTALTCMGDQGSTPSRDTGRGQGAGQAAERPRVEWESLATNMNYPLTTGEVKVTMDATMGFTANSGVPSGPGLWHMAVYGSREDSDSTHDKFGYTGNVLTPKQAKTRIAPGRSTTISGISFRMDMSRIGCPPYYFLCIEYGKGTSDSYDMAYPRNDRGVSCERRQCN